MHACFDELSDSCVRLYIAILQSIAAECRTATRSGSREGLSATEPDWRAAFMCIVPIPLGSDVSELAANYLDRSYALIWINVPGSGSV